MIIHIITAFVIASRVVDVIGVLLYILYACIIYDDKYQIKITFTILFQVILILLTTIMLNMLAYILKVNISHVIEFYTYKRILIIWFIKLNIYLIIFAIKKFFTKPRYMIPNRYKYLILSIFLISFISVLVIFEISLLNDNPYFYKFIILLSAVFLSFNIIIYWLFNKVLVYIQEQADTLSNLHNQQLLEQHILELESTHQEIRKIKHDISNHYAILQHLIEEDNKKDTLEYLGELRAIIEKVPKLYKTGDLIVDAVINQKVYKAKQSHIKCELDIVLPKEINIKPIDMCTILANLLDNAIEAAKEVNGEKFIRVKICPHLNFLLVNIFNSVKENPIKEDKLIKRKKDNAIEHGYGISNVEYTVKKYNGSMQYKCKDNIFDIAILLEYI